MSACSLHPIPVAILLWAIAVAALAQPRTWTDSKGTMSVEAELLGVHDNVVLLEKSNGSRLGVLIEKLSEKDRRYVESSIRTQPQLLEQSVSARLSLDYYTFLLFVSLAAVLLALLLTLGAEPVFRILGEKPLWFELLICLSLPFGSGFMFGACGSAGPGPDVGSGIRIGVGFAAGVVVAVSVLLGRWFPRAVVLMLLVAASVGWFIVGYVNSSGPVHNLSDVITRDLLVISLTFAIVALSTAISVWCFRAYAERSK